ncbi:MAG: hypothetical protein O3A00_04680 [Planctomycetota bacterium]|nr:hypothetical protein [Planctomycetota bacterium]
MPTIADELRAEGRQEGRNGLRVGIQTVVEQRFSQAASAVVDRIKTIDSIETLTQILQIAGRCDSIAELEEFISA